MAGVIGELVEKPGEFHGEWLIADFLNLEKRVDKYYWSGKFFFSGTCWELKIYPNGETEHMSEGWIGLYIHRGDWGSPLTVSYSLGVKKADGTESILFRRDSRPFLKEKGGWGTAKFLKRSDPMNSELVPSGALTVVCNLKSERQLSTDVSLCRRLWNMSSSLQDILNSQRKTDVVLKLTDGKICAHQVILEARCEVFNRMFASDMQESQTGEVKVEDGDMSAFQIVLAYVYSGDPSGLSSKNVDKVYRIAHKYDLQELKKMCTDFMLECLSVDTVCDVIAVAEMYQEEETMQRAKEYFVNNATLVVKTDKWKSLKKENPIIVSELLECILLENACNN